MSERFEDFWMFMIGGALLSTFAFFMAVLWVAATSPNLPFCERWAPVIGMPDAAEPFHRYQQRPAEIPVFFCGRSPFQCRTV